MFLLGIGMRGISVCTTWKIVASLKAAPDPTGLQTGINGGQRPVSTVVGGFNRTSYGKSYLRYSVSKLGWPPCCRNIKSNIFFAVFQQPRFYLFTLHPPIF